MGVAASRPLPSVLVCTLSIIDDPPESVLCAGCTSTNQNFSLPEAAVSGCTHAPMTGSAEDLLKATSCTVFRVQRRWTACTLIWIHASIAFTDKTVPTVALINNHCHLPKLQHQPTTSSKSSAHETANKATYNFTINGFLATYLIPRSTKKCQASAICGY